MYLAHDELESKYVIVNIENYQFRYYLLLVILLLILFLECFCGVQSLEE